MFVFSQFYIKNPGCDHTKSLAPYLVIKNKFSLSNSKYQFISHQDIHNPMIFNARKIVSFPFTI